VKKLLKVSFQLLVKKSPVLASHLLYIRTFRRRLRLRNPQTINEKLMWLKLYEKNPLKSKYADKLEVRNYVSACGFRHLLIDMIDVYDSAEAIDFSTLPNQFVLKCTHGSGYNIFCLDQATFQYKQARAKLKEWQQENYGLKRAELHYYTIQPRIIAEKLLEYDEDMPLDYHIHCFHGKPRLIGVQIQDDYLLFNEHWELLPFNEASEQFSGTLPKPQNLAEMLEIAKTLSTPFTYVRVDLYDAHNQIYFSELTFTPAACLDADFINNADYIVGEMLDLKEVAYQKGKQAEYELAVKQK
jgi:hypothetical protein